jgi:hypothetical protein
MSSFGYDFCFGFICEQITTKTIIFYTFEIMVYSNHGYLVGEAHISQYLNTLSYKFKVSEMNNFKVNKKWFISLNI